MKETERTTVPTDMRTAFVQSENTVLSEYKLWSFRKCNPCVRVRKEDSDCNGMKRKRRVDVVNYVVSLRRISRRVVLPYVYVFEMREMTRFRSNSLQFIGDLSNKMASVNRSTLLRQAVL